MTEQGLEIKMDTNLEMSLPNKEIEGAVVTNWSHDQWKE